MIAVGLLIILSSIISAGYGHVVDVEYSEEFFDPVGVKLETNPNDGFVFDVLPRIPESSRAIFLLRFRVKSGGETHVALSDEHQGQGSMYDIVFGTNRNRYTAVRRCENQNCQEVATALMPDAVSLDQIQDLWIGYNWNLGMIAAGRGADSAPEIEARTSNMFKVSDLGFSTLHGTVGYWWFPSEYFVVHGCGNLVYQTGDMEYIFRYNLPVVPHSSSTDLDFKFSAYAESEARILLASEVGVSDQKPAYEIIIGAAQNTKSEIRRCINAIECCPVIATAQTPGLLNKQLGLQKFHIIYNNGLLKVFFEDDDTPLLTSFDPNPISVRAIGYAQGPTTRGKFEFPAQGIALGLLVFDTTGDHVFNLGLPLVPEDKASNLELSFLVRASKEVHIAFSPEPDIDNYDDIVYKVIIGGWNNRKALITLCKSPCPSMRRVDNAGLNENEFRQFRISVNMGLITLYSSQLVEPIISWQHNTGVHNFLKIKAVGFSTGNGVSGRFVFDPCNLYK